MDPIAAATLVTTVVGAALSVLAVVFGAKKDKRVVHKDELAIVVEDQRAEITAVRAARAMDQERFQARIDQLETRVAAIEAERNVLANKVWAYEHGMTPP